MGSEDDVTTPLPSTSETGSGGGGGGGRFRHTSFLKWRQNNKSDVSGMNVDGEFKKWPHPPEALHKGKVTYVVKFLGFVNVEEPKGIEVVRSAIQKMKFSKSVKKAEGIKSAKKELVISVDSITIQDSKYKIIDHCYPLHRISFCADDKSDKRMFAFIAKDGEDHICYVFDSEKCAEEITLTVGQAFEIAYQNFVEVQGKPSSLKEEMVKLKHQVEAYEKENAELKAHVKELEAKLGLTSRPKDDAAVNRVAENSAAAISAAAISAAANSAAANGAAANGAAVNSGAQNGVVGVNLIDTAVELTLSPAPYQQDPVVGRRLENLLFDEELFDAPKSSAVAASVAPAPPAPTASASLISAPAAASPPSPSTIASTQPLQAATNTSTMLPSLAPPPRPSRRTSTAAAATSFNASTSAAGDSLDLFGSTPFAPAAGSAVAEVNGALSGASLSNVGAPGIADDPFGTHDDLFGMSPFQNEMQPTFQNAVDISFGSGNLDFGSSFQDFNQNSGASIGSPISPVSLTATKSTPNPFL